MIHLSIHPPGYAHPRAVTRALDNQFFAGSLKAPNPQDHTL